MRINRRKYRTLAFAYKTAGLLWGLVHVCAVVGFFDRLDAAPALRGDRPVFPFDRKRLYRRLLEGRGESRPPHPADRRDG